MKLFAFEFDFSILGMHRVLSYAVPQKSEHVGKVIIYFRKILQLSTKCSSYLNRMR